jgi:chemotaxis protein CheZ
MANARDNEDLEALFDQISSETLARINETSAVPAEAPVVAPTQGTGRVLSASGPAEGESPEFYHRVGALTRQLHDALRELGYHQKVEQAVNSLPDTRQRLDYIARLTGQAAERALSNVEKGQDIQSRVETGAVMLEGQWSQLYARKLGVEDFKQVAAQTHAYLKASAEDSRATQALLTDIMMAQDFHDLTGQVIQKVLKLAQDFEEELVKLLIESTPPEKRNASHSEWMNGPVVDVADRDDIVTDQAQVDDLLESLGF